jgi:hypothetical protein
MFVRVWEYSVRPEHRHAFVGAYGPDGDWAALFARHPGWVATDLFVSLTSSDRFITVDRWVDAQSWDGFRAAWSREYDDLGRRLRWLSVENGPLVTG